MISNYILQNIKDFTEQDFSSWQNQMRNIERNLSQTLDVTNHSNFTTHNNQEASHANNHVNNAIPHNNVNSSHSNNHINQHHPHSNWGGFHSNSHSNSHSNFNFPSTHSNSHTNTTPHNQTGTSHTNNHTNTTTNHSDTPARHWDTHVNIPNQHTDTRGNHSNNHTNVPHSNIQVHNDYRPQHHTNNRVTPRTSPSHIDFCIPNCHSNIHNNRAHQNTGHNNAGQHTNRTGHSNNGLYNQTIEHRNTPSTHTNTGHSQTRPGTNHTQHSNSGHSQTHPHGNHNQHLNNHGHSNFISHDNVNAWHNNNGQHSQFIPHTNVGAVHTNTGHANSIPHTNVSTHNNVGFNHQNYIPSRPRFFNIAENEKVTGRVRVGLFSYDKNTDGHGSQDVNSQEVLYTVRIRRVSNLDGTANTSGWVTLLNQSSLDSFELNTLNPLNNGNLDYRQAEGHYEIRAFAQNRNRAENGVAKTYISDAQSITIRIVHNHRPSAEVLNGDEFIGFTFGQTGVLNRNDEFKSYDNNLYNRANSNQVEGLFINLRMKDKDSSQWQRGTVFLTQNGQEILGTRTQIIWENGQSQIQSGGALKEGYAFLSKEVLSQVGTSLGVNVVVKIEDFFDPNLQFKTAETVHLYTISENNSELLLINIDAVAPNIVFSSNGNETYGRTRSTNITVTDDLSGVEKVEYQWTKAGEDINQSSWTEISANASLTTPTAVSGDYHLNIRAVDRLGNTRVLRSNRFRLDNTAPSLNLSYNQSLTNQPVVVSVIATDSFSGINRIIMPDGSIVHGNTATFITGGNGMFTFTVMDNVGHTISQTITISNIDTTPPNINLINYELSIDSWTNQNVIISIDASEADDNGIADIRLPNGVVVSGDTASYEVSENGNYTFIIRDRAGNTAIITIPVQNIDKTPPPSPTILVPTDSWINKNAVIFLDNIIDDLSGVKQVQYKLSNETTVTSWFNYHDKIVVSTEGITTIHARVTDRAGNISEMSTATVRVDKTAPQNNQIRIRPRN